MQWHHVIVFWHQNEYQAWLKAVRISFKHNINIPDIIIKIMPGASLWHRKGHVSGHSTRSLGRGQTPHSGFTKRNSCQKRRLQRKKNLNVSRSNHGWGCNVMQILIFVNCDTKIACLGKLDRSNLLKPAFINALKMTLMWSHDVRR